MKSLKENKLINCYINKNDKNQDSTIFTKGISVDTKSIERCEFISITLYMRKYGQMSYLTVFIFQNATNS